MIDLTLIKTLADTGTTGLLLAISIGFNVFLFRVFKDSQEKRIQDMRETSTSILQPLNSLKESSEIQTNFLRQILKAVEQ